MAERQIVIIGFMGCGKTTVAQALAAELNCPWVDLDSLITAEEGRAPKEIIEEEGEAEFRKIETAALRKLLSEESARVISAGGGLWADEVNRNLIREHNLKTIWLDAPFERCWQRIKEGGETRPLATTREMAERLFGLRQPIYALADNRIKLDDTATPQAIAKNIVRAISPDSTHT